jgi:hypothetical protein
MAEKRSTALWRAAVPLNQAWLKLAPDEQREAHLALPGTKGAVNDPANYPENSGFWGRLVSAAGAASQAYLEETASASALRADLVRRISEGEFELLGFRTDPTRSRSPVVISELNFGKYPLDWKSESLDIRDERYIDLRVSRGALRVTGIKRGRPGSTDAILAAIDTLRLRPNSNFCKLPRAQACEHVRTLISERGIDTSQLGNGLSDKNISKLILRQCPKRQIENFLDK